MTTYAISPGRDIAYAFKLRRVVILQSATDEAAESVEVYQAT
jgi:hypothetical protein